MSRRWLASLSGALLLGAVFASPAAAHDALVASDPPDGAVLDATPEAIVLEFTGNILELNPGLELTGPDGETVEVGEAQVDGTFVTWEVLGELAGGQHDVVWVVTSSDGHPIDGELSFTAPTPAAPEATDPEPLDPEATAVQPAGTDPATPEATATAGQGTGDPTPTESAPTGSSEPADLSDNAEAWFFGGLAVTALVVVGFVLVVRRNRDPNGPPGQH